VIGSGGNFFSGYPAKGWRFFRVWRRRHRLQLGFALRVTAAAMLSLAIALYFGLRLPLWAVITALIVTQMSVGKSLSATVDYMIGTVGGALYGGLLAVLIPHSSNWALFALLATAVAPLAFIATINPRLSAAPVTAVIVLLVPMITHATPLASAIDRVFEVAVGALTGFLVSYLLLPSRAHVQAIELAAQTLDQLTRALRALLAGLSRGLDTEDLHRIQDGIGRSLVQLNTICGEADHERAVGLGREPDLRPLTRTILRLRHDLVMLGRATQVPLPSPLRPLLGPRLADIEASVAGFLSDCARALRGRLAPPPLDTVDHIFESYLASFASVRVEGLTRDLPTDAAERFFALGFVMEQIRRDLADLHRCVAENAGIVKRDAVRDDAAGGGEAKGRQAS